VVHCKNSNSSFRPKKMLTRRGTKSYTNRPNTHWKRRQSGKEELFWKAKEKMIFQWFCFSVERSEKTSPVTRHHPPALWRINNWQTIWMSSIAGLKKHHSHLLQPPSPHTCTADKRSWCAPGLQKEQKKEGTRPRQCDTSLSEILCWPAGPYLHTDLQQIAEAVQSTLMLQMLHHHPHPKETQNYWT